MSRHRRPHFESVPPDFLPATLRRPRFVAAGVAVGLALGLAIAAGSCSKAPAAPPSSDPTPAAPAVADAPSPGGAPETTRRPRVVFLGDSLTAGYGLAEEQAFPARLGELLAAEGHPIDVVNAGVSGDTSAGGVARLDWILRQKPDVVVVELGPNDGLRGLPLEMTEANLRAIVERCRAAGARVLLVGMQIPPNYGPEYSGAFRALYPRLAKELNVPLVPFLLAGVGGEPGLNLGDGLHPNVEGQRIVARNVLPYLREVLAVTRR